MKTDIVTLDSMGAWGIVGQDVNINFILLTCYFKFKRYPDGLIKIFKSRFCARGNQQLEGGS